MSVPQISLENYKQDSFSCNFTVKKSDGTVQDITGWSLWMTFKYNLSDADADAVAQATVIDASISIVDAVNGVAKVEFLNPPFTDVPNNVKLLCVDIKGKSPDGEIQTLAAGTVKIRQGVTRAIL